MIDSRRVRPAHIETTTAFQQARVTLCCLVRIVVALTVALGSYDVITLYRKKCKSQHFRSIVVKTYSQALRENHWKTVDILAILWKVLWYRMRFRTWYRPSMGTPTLKRSTRSPGLKCLCQYLVIPAQARSFFLRPFSTEYWSLCLFMFHTTSATPVAHALGGIICYIPLAWLHDGILHLIRTLDLIVCVRSLLYQRIQIRPS